MPAVPEFILRKLYVRDSFKVLPGGFSFGLNNSFAPATIVGFGLQVDGITIPAEKLHIQAGDGIPQPIAALSQTQPFSFSVGVLYTIHVQGDAPRQGRLTLQVNTVEAGPLEFTIRLSEKKRSPKPQRSVGLSRAFRRALALPYRAEVRVHSEEVIGEIHPYVYGHFIEHLERCIYGGIWSSDGSTLREDTLALIRDLRPPVIRYPGGNFASGYHWEDGIGPKGSRPPRFDQAWSAMESNQVGTNEFLDFCAQVAADPFLVVNDGSGTPEEAARWVAYCNQPAVGEQGRRRLANGHPEPYGVRLWGVGNEVWGPWQIGHTGAREYAARLRQFADAMRQVDASIQIVAVGDKVLSAGQDDPGWCWNQMVLEEAGDAIDHLSFHLYQPDREGWLERYDLEALHHTVCAAPLDAEEIIQRIAHQIREVLPGRKIGVAFDEWNLWLAPPEGAGSMHQVVYTLRDALYVAGMFHVFHRQCQSLSMANLAQLVNVLPAIVTDEHRAFATTIYYPFWMYQFMGSQALAAEVDAPTFESQPLGNIRGHQKVTFLDVSVTRDKEGKQLAFGMINRHPYRPARVVVNLPGLRGLQATQVWQLCAEHPLAANTLDHPTAVRTRPGEAPQLRDEGFTTCLPACSISVLTFQS